MKEAMKIDSIEAHIVRKVKGYGSQCGRPGMLLTANQAPNTTACTQTKWMLPQKRATKAAVRSAKLGSATASSSSSFTVRTLRRVISAACAWGASSGDMAAVLAQPFPAADRRARMTLSAAL